MGAKRPPFFYALLLRPRAATTIAWSGVSSGALAFGAAFLVSLTSSGLVSEDLRNGIGEKQVKQIVATSLCLRLCAGPREKRGSWVGPLFHGRK